MHVGRVEMPSQTCKHSLKTTDQIGYTSLMGKAGFSLKASATERVYLQKWNIVLFRGWLGRRIEEKNCSTIH